jgi:hypothetical protein
MMIQTGVALTRADTPTAPPRQYHPQQLAVQGLTLGLLRVRKQRSMKIADEQTTADRPFRMPLLHPRVRGGASQSMNRIGVQIVYLIAEE